MYSFQNKPIHGTSRSTLYRNIKKALRTRYVPNIRGSIKVENEEFQDETGKGTKICCAHVLKATKT